MSTVDSLQRVFVYFDPGCRGVGKRVFGNCLQVVSCYQIGQMRWRFAFVLRVLINSVSHSVKILFEYGFIASALLIGAPCSADQ